MSVPPDKENLEKKMVENEVITSADIKSYADFLIQELEKLKESSGQEKETFIIDALSNDRITDLIVDKEEFNSLTTTEVESVVKKIRKALIEELKGKIEDRLYFVIKDLKNKDIYGLSHTISEVMAASGEVKIYKHQPPYENEQEYSREAFKLLMSLPSHENIVNVHEYDPESHKSILEKLNLSTLAEYLKTKETSKENFVSSLKIVRDCLEGAEYLKASGLALQDIAPANLGIANADGSLKGTLFDLEGLRKIGSRTKYRIIQRPHERYAPPEIDLEGGNIIRSEEMVFQFGVCIKDILEKYKYFPYISSVGIGPIFGKLEKLVEEMTKKDYQYRIGLEDAKTKLANIVAAFEAPKKKGFFGWLLNLGKKA